MHPQNSTIPGAHGLGIHVVEWSREGVPLVLVHGFGNDTHVWDDFAPEVAGYYRTLAVDLRGHGDSEHDPDRRYDYDTHVADLEAVLQSLGVERMVLVGHSFGGRVSTLFAAKHAERMAGLVIVDAGPNLDVRGTTRIMQDTQKQIDLTFTSARDYERVLAHAYPAATPEAIARLAEHGLRRDTEGRLVRKTDPAFHGARGSMTPEEAAKREKETTWQLWDALRKISCPTLVVRGAASDVLSPDTADEMVEEALGDGRLAVVPQSSHSVMIDNPAGFAEAVGGFVLGGG